MYSIEIEENAEKFLKKISHQDAEIILKKIYSLKDNPFQSLKRLKGHKLYRLRTLKYRIIVDIVISGKRIVVLRIGHRKNIYKK